MEIKITFEGMPHSQALEKVATEKILKIKELISDPEWKTPRFVELWLKANNQHKHHLAKLHLKTPDFDLNSESEDTDMYLAVDNTVNKMITLVRKEKNKIKDLRKNGSSEKRDFSKDKYNL